jgi:hypothetical protein
MDPSELQQLESQASGAGAGWALRRAGSLRMSGGGPRRLTGSRSGAPEAGPPARRTSLAGAGGSAAALLAAGGPLGHGSGGAASPGSGGGGSPFASAAAQEISPPLLGARPQQQRQQEQQQEQRQQERQQQQPCSLSDRDILALAQRRGTLGLSAQEGGEGVDKGRTPTQDEAFALECVMLAKGLAARLAQGRVPVPELALVLRSSAGSGEVLARLAPIAGDAAEEQEAQLPALLELSREELAGLVALHAGAGAGGGPQAQSFLHWCRAAGVEGAGAAA